MSGILYLVSLIIFLGLFACYILNKKGINETTTTFSVGAETTRGDMGYDAPSFIDKETAERKPGFSCQTSPIQKKKMKK